MADKATSWRFVEDYPNEPAVIAEARSRAGELGVAAIAPSVGSLLAGYAAATGAETIVEIGTGAGVSGLWLFAGARGATLTTIDPEIAYQDAARRAFESAGVPGRQFRMIGKRAADVIDKLADGSYDMVVVDADSDGVSDYVEHGIRLTRRGGVVVVAHVLHDDRTADPTARDATTRSYRELLDRVTTREDVLVSLVSIDDGVLVLVTL